MSDTLSNGDILKALGLKLPNTQANPIRDLWNKIQDQKDYSTFNSDVQALASFSEFETYLQNDLGFSADNAATFRQQMETKYTDFSDFQTTLDGFDSFEEWENSISWGETVGGESIDEEGRKVNGFRFHDESGLTRDNVSVPSGTVELFGKEIHFSQTGTPRDDDDSTSDTGDGSLFSLSNMSADVTSPIIGQIVDFSVDLTSNSDYNENYLPVLKKDGETVREGDLVKISPGATRPLTLDLAFEEEGSYQIRFNDGPSITIDVEPQTVTGF